MTEVCDTRQPRYRSLTEKEKHREWVFFGAMGLLLAALVGALALALSLYLQINNPGIHRSDSEMINGGKRFIDGFYSLNAGTIDRDQFRAINMIVDKQMRTAELENLSKQDLIRKTQQSGMQSRIEWIGSEVEIIERGEGAMRIRYKAFLVRNERDASPLDVVLTLVPVEKSDINTDGVGVLNWVDIAENPFEVNDETN